MTANLTCTNPRLATIIAIIVANGDIPILF